MNSLKTISMLVFYEIGLLLIVNKHSCVYIVNIE